MVSDYMKALQPLFTFVTKERESRLGNLTFLVI